MVELPPWETAPRHEWEVLDLEVLDAPPPAPFGEAGTLRADADDDVLAEWLDELIAPDAAVALATMRDLTVDAVRARAAQRAEGRPGKVKHTADLRPELVGLGADADALAGLAAVFTAGADEATALAGDLIGELPGNRRSARVEDGHGFDLTVKLDQRRETKVDVDAVVDVIVADRLAAADRLDPQAYANGVRDGVAALRDLLTSSPTWRTSALDVFVTRLQDGGQADLATRLSTAYGRVEVGEPRPKLTRTPTKAAES